MFENDADKSGFVPEWKEPNDDGESWKNASKEPEPKGPRVLLMGRPKRITAIDKNDIADLCIALATCTSFEDFLARV